MIAARKKLKLGRAYLESLVHPIPLWTHLWITNKCNLNCDYCYVVDNHSKDPHLEEVQSWIAHSDYLGTAIVAFMGGEPLLRKDLAEIISSADQRNLMTYLTTNGKLLTPKRLEELAQAGLDILEISVDGYDQAGKSGKTLDGKETLIDWLEDTHRKYGMRFKIHQVLSPKTIAETPNLVELVKNRRIPISFGMVYQADKTVSFSPKEKEKMEQTLRLIMESKRKGLSIINPLRYFQDAWFSLEHPYKMNCDIGRYMVQASTNGKVYVCSKLGEESEVRFLDIDKDYFRNDQHKSKELLERCSHKCLSACAYTTNYFRENPLSFISTFRKG
jgi:MoaA/NifB/PqqE/SkfB family radical SAM enzyme